MAHDVFISYSSKDKAIAEAAYAALEKQGINCWIDSRSILPGQDYSSEIINGIPASRLLLLIFSAHSNASRHVLREVKIADDHELIVIPWRIEKVEPSHSLQFFLALRQWLDALTPPIEDHLERLVNEVKRALPVLPALPPVPDGGTTINEEKFLGQCKQSDKAYFQQILEYCQSNQNRLNLEWGTKGVSIKNQQKRPLLWMFPHRETRSIEIKDSTNPKISQVASVLQQHNIAGMSFTPSELPVDELKKIIDLLNSSAEEQYVARMPLPSQKIYQEMKNRALSFGPDVKTGATGSYLKFEVGKNFASFRARKSGLIVGVRPQAFDNLEGGAFSVHGIELKPVWDGEYIENFSFHVDETTDFNAVEKLLRQSYDTVSNKPSQSWQTKVVPTENYQPQPLDTSAVVLPPEIVELTEALAKNTHEVWSQGRMQDGWRHGPQRDDAKKEHPSLVPYEELSESEKEYDRRTALETLKAIISLGYRVERD